MTGEVVASVGELEDLVHVATVQRALQDVPLHIWFPGRRSDIVDSAEKHRLHEALCDREVREGRAPLLLPASEVLHESFTLSQVLARILVPHVDRRCFSPVSGTFQGGRLEAVSPSASVPFPDRWFLLAARRVLEGVGTFEDVLTRGALLVRYPRAFRLASECHDASPSRDPSLPARGSDLARSSQPEGLRARGDSREEGS